MFNIISAKSFIRRERIKKAKNILFTKRAMCQYVNKKLKNVDTSYHNEIKFNIDDFIFRYNILLKDAEVKTLFETYLIPKLEKKGYIVSKADNQYMSLLYHIKWRNNI